MCYQKSPFTMLENGSETIDVIFLLTFTVYVAYLDPLQKSVHAEGRHRAMIVVGC